MSYIRTEEHKEKMKKIINSPEVHDKISKALSGENNPNYGKHWSDKAKIALSKKSKGKHFSPATELKKGNKLSLGVHRSQAQKDKLSRIFKGKHRSPASEFKKGQKHSWKVPRGKDNPNWRGGLTAKPYPYGFDKQLKALVRDRDNYTCQFCGKPEYANRRKLAVHHIDYDKKNLNLDNLVSLCNSCNIRVNYNRDYWSKYLRNPMRLHKELAGAISDKIKERLESDR